NEGVFEFEGDDVFAVLKRGEPAVDGDRIFAVVQFGLGEQLSVDEDGDLLRKITVPPEVFDVQFQRGKKSENDLCRISERGVDPEPSLFGADEPILSGDLFPGA